MGGLEGNFFSYYGAISDLEHPADGWSCLYFVSINGQSSLAVEWSWTIVFTVCFSHTAYFTETHWLESLIIITQIMLFLLGSSPNPTLPPFPVDPLLSTNPPTLPSLLSPPVHSMLTPRNKKPNLSCCGWDSTYPN